MANVHPLPNNKPGFRVNGPIFDTLVNLLSGLGTAKDKTTQTRFTMNVLDRQQLFFAYRGDWIARKIINAPAEDSTREWREWQADKKDITELETTERELKVQLRVKQAMQRARLLGGAALIMGVNSGSPDQELRVDRVKKGQLQYVHVVNRDDISPGRLNYDVTSEYYGEPMEYTVNSPDTGQVVIHHSRVIRFIGNEIPDINQAPDGWGDSVLQTIYDAVIQAGQTAANVATLVNEAKIDIIKVPGLMENMGTAEYRSRVIERFTLANSMKSLTNALLLDGEEEWDRMTAQFAGLPDIIRMYLLMASGAADIPATRLLGQSASGFNATGTEDTRNYYDRLSSDQTNDLGPRMDRLDEVLIRSTFGDKPDEVTYAWKSLWQLSDTESADIAAKKAQVYTADVNANLIPPEVLREGRENQLIEDGVYPGLEVAIDEYGEQNLDEYNQAVVAQMGARAALMAPDDPNDPKGGSKKAKATQLEFKRRAALPPPRPPAARSQDSWVERHLVERRGNAFYTPVLDETKPRSLYVRRDVLNGEEILAHFEEQGVDVGGIDPDELHVTVLYSRQLVDWIKMGESGGYYAPPGSNDDEYAPEGTDMCVRAGGPRVMEGFGTPPDTLVMCFASSRLCWRHEDMIRRGASSDYSDYTPHVSVAPLGSWDPRDLEPFQGEIFLGPEIFEPCKVGGAEGETYDADWDESKHKRKPKGGAGGGEFDGGGDDPGPDDGDLTGEVHHAVVTFIAEQIVKGEPMDPRDKPFWDQTPEKTKKAALRAARVAIHGKGAAADYDPGEPRAAAGSSAGGQWTREGAAAARQARIDRVLETQRQRAEGDVGARLKRTREAAVAKTKRVTAAAAHRAAEFLKDHETRAEGLGMLASSFTGQLAGADIAVREMVHELVSSFAKQMDAHASAARGAVRAALNKAIELRRGLTGDADPAEGGEDDVLELLEALLAELEGTDEEVQDWRRDVADYRPDQLRGKGGKWAKEGGGGSGGKAGRGKGASKSKAGAKAGAKGARTKAGAATAEKRRQQFEQNANFIRRLNDAGNDRKKFESVMKDLDAAKLSKDQLVTILKDYRLTASMVYTARMSRPALLERFRADFTHMKRFLSKVGIDSITLDEYVVMMEDYSPDQPRAPAGTGRGGQFTTIVGGELSEHARAAGLNVRLLKSKRLASGKSFEVDLSERELSGLTKKKSVEVAQEFKVGAKWRRNPDQAGDYAAGIGLMLARQFPSLARFAEQFWYDAAAGMTPKEYAYAKSYFATRDGAFAEGYRAAFSPNGKAFGLSKARAEEVFGRSVGQLRTSVGSAISGTSGSAPREGVFSRMGSKLARLIGA